jgi:hypothetical protein
MSHCRPRRFAGALAVALAFALATSAVAAADAAKADPGGRPPAPVVARGAGPAAAAGAPVDSAVRPAPVHPMMGEIRAALEAEQSKLLELRARMNATRDPASHLAIQREVEQVKRGTEIAILRIQAAHARRDGRAALADRIDAAIEEMLRPVARGVPAARPAPGDPTRSAR